MIIFLWKISQGLVSGYNVEFRISDQRRGRLAIPSTVIKSAAAPIRKAKENSLKVRGVHLFNLLPENLRNLNSDHTDLFKNHLDIFLASVPDQPTVTGLARAAESNSLVHQLPLLYRVIN